MRLLSAEYRFHSTSEAFHECFADCSATHRPIIRSLSLSPERQQHGLGAVVFTCARSPESHRRRCCVRVSQDVGLPMHVAAGSRKNQILGQPGRLLDRSHTCFLTSWDR